MRKLIYIVSLLLLAFALSGCQDKVSVKGVSENTTQTKDKVDLELKLDNVEILGSHVVLKANIKNTGDVAVKYVKVKGVIYDADNNVMTTETTYAVGSDGLETGERKIFKMYTDYESGIYYAEVEVIDYDIAY